MNFLRHKLRYFLALQLLPALESPSQEALIGGQAVLEGVMMRSPHAWGLAVRRHTGDIATFWARFGLRILLLPVIASVSYEMIRFSAKHGKSLFALLTRPGMWMQRITTKQPSDDMVECAIKALDEAMSLEKANGGELVIA